MPRMLIVIRWPVGGIRTFLRYVFNCFDSQKFALDVIAPDCNEARVLLDDLSRFQVRLLPCTSPVSHASLVRQVALQLRRMKYDLVYSHGFTAGICASLASFGVGTKHMMTSHDVLLDGQLAGLAGFLKRKAMEIMFRRIDLVHAVGEDARSNLFSYLPGLKSIADRVIVIPHGIDTGRFMTENRRDIKAELGLDESTFLIGFFGRFMSQKGFTYLVDAVDLLVRSDGRLRDLAVVSFGYGGWIREEQRSIEQKGLGRYFKFLPFEANIAESLRGLDVVAMPSLWEACPLLPMEAMVAGVPLIGTNCIGLREVLKGTPHAMIPKADGAALARALANEMALPTSGAAIRFRPVAAARFDVRQRAREVERVIEALLNLRVGNSGSEGLSEL